MNGDDLEHAGRKRLEELNEAMKDADPSDALRRIADVNARAGSAMTSLAKRLAADAAARASPEAIVADDADYREALKRWEATHPAGGTCTTGDPGPKNPPDTSK